MLDKVLNTPLQSQGKHRGGNSYYVQLQAIDLQYYYVSIFSLTLQHSKTLRMQLLGRRLVNSCL